MGGTMRHALFLLAAALLALGCAPVPKDRPVPADRMLAKDERVLKSQDGKAIMAMLDGVDARGPGRERFMVMTIRSGNYLTIRPAYVIAWFRYVPGDQNVAIDYASFPLYKKGSDLFATLYKFEHNSKDTEEGLRSSNMFNFFLNEITYNKGMVGAENMKRMDAPLPPGLRGDALLDEMSKYVPTNRSQTGHGDLYYWGIKTGEYEMIHSSVDFGLYDYEAMTADTEPDTVADPGRYP
jgi:hypothetical protein